MGVRHFQILRRSTQPLYRYRLSAALRSKKCIVKLLHGSGGNVGKAADCGVGRWRKLSKPVAIERIKKQNNHRCCSITEEYLC